MLLKNSTSLGRTLYLLSTIAALLLSSCSPNKTPNLSSATVSWQANRETSVNSNGGGYTVYYSTKSGFDVQNALGSVDVPYVSGGSAPTTATLYQLDPGTYYVKVVARSALVTPLAIPAVSAPSPELAIIIPRKVTQ